MSIHSATLRATAGYSSGVTALRSGMTQRRRGASGVCECVEYRHARQSHSAVKLSQSPGLAASASSVTSHRSVTAAAVRRPPLSAPPTNPPTSLRALCSSRLMLRYSRIVSPVRLGVRSRSSNQSQLTSIVFHRRLVRLPAVAIFMCFLHRCSTLRPAARAGLRRTMPRSAPVCRARSPL